MQRKGLERTVHVRILIFKVLSSPDSLLEAQFLVRLIKRRIKYKIKKIRSYARYADVTNDSLNFTPKLKKKKKCLFHLSSPLPIYPDREGERSEKEFSLSRRTYKTENNNNSVRLDGICAVI